MRRVLVVLGTLVVAGLIVWFFYHSSGADNLGVMVTTYPGLLMAMVTGYFGATFSMLTQTNQRSAQGTLDDVEVASSWHRLILRCLFGIGAAAILYFFFESGLLEGGLWPDINQLGFLPIEFTRGDGTGTLHVAQYNVPNNHWCLLVIWSFIAGFSENFVPTLLVRTERRCK